ncbi:PDDEXK nuclease domain-containing protein [Testudinibacter sp. P80/BLE/0925]|uniref:PDDEXK nuclease domain-containing protein n=1 Tax=Testudinibacter sp. TW-1 TaxID=3417757 RepID=UPI003D365162
MNTNQDIEILPLADKIAELLKTARQRAVAQVNQAMVLTYFEIGRMIVEDEQGGHERAAYGKAQLKRLSRRLTAEFGRGFSVENLDRMRFFYKTYSQPISSTVLTNSEASSQKLEKGQTPSDEFKLSWSHYIRLMRIADPLERRFYEVEAAKNNWSLRELNRQYDSALFTRLALSKDKQGVLSLALQGQVIETPQDVIKDPYVLEFLGLPEHSQYSESKLEQRLIDKLEHFLLELGTGFAFVSRQQRISLDDQHFYVDLVFYNRVLRCFVLIDLKLGRLKHQDLGQMQMYVNYYDRKMRLPDENQTIGIVLCQDKSEAVVEFTLPEGNSQIFASRYLTVLPSKAQLQALLVE